MEVKTVIRKIEPTSTNTQPVRYEVVIIGTGSERECRWLVDKINHKCCKDWDERERECMG